MTLGKGPDTPLVHKESLCEVEDSNFPPKKIHELDTFAQTDRQADSKILNTWGGGGLTIYFNITAKIFALILP